MGRKFFVGGNWKCNAAEVPSEEVVEVMVSPPFVFLPLVKSLMSADFSVAAQNCWVRKGGAFTGEIRYTLADPLPSGFYRAFGFQYLVGQTQ